MASNSLSIGSGATWSFLNRTGGTTTYYYTTSDSAGLTLTGAGAAVNVAPKAVITQSGTVTGGFGLTVSGAGTVMMSGANDYTGGTSVSAGTIIKAGSATAFGTGAVTVAASGSTGGAVDLNGQTMTSTGTLTLRGTGVSVDGVSTGALFNSSSTTASYAGLVALASASSIVGNTGGIILSNTSATGITGNFALTLGGAQGGRIDSRIAFTTTAGTLTKQDAGTWTLNGASTVTSTTTISAGVLKAGHANALGPTTGAGAITVSSGAALDLNGQAVTSTGTLTLNGTGINNGGALMNSGAAASYAGLMALGSDSSIIGGSGTIALGNTGTINGSGKNLTLGGAQGGSI
ncbi:MAG: hypothetical protein EBT33_22360, partial [Betaproteobacteria bacterium]|nr:hypothetical protein [Betaproteobacteria bacterium]